MHANTITVHTAGASTGGPQKRGPGGYAALLHVPGQPSRAITGHHPETTANSMSITAVLQAIVTMDSSRETTEDSSRETTEDSITIWTPSDYIVNAFNQGWLELWRNNGWRKADKRPLPNRELWTRLHQALGQRPRAIRHLTPGRTDPAGHLCVSLAAKAMGEPTQTTLVRELTRQEEAQLAPAQTTSLNSLLDIAEASESPEQLLQLLKQMATARRAA